MDHIANHREAIIKNIAANFLPTQTNEQSVFSQEGVDSYKRDLQKSFDLGEIGKDEFEKGLKDLTKLQKKIITNSQGHQQTVYVRVHEDKTEHHFKHDDKVSFEHKGEKKVGTIKGLKHHEKFDPFGTATIHDEAGNKYSKSLRAIEHHGDNSSKTEPSIEEAAKAQKVERNRVDKLPKELEQNYVSADWKDSEELIGQFTNAYEEAGGSSYDDGDYTFFSKNPITQEQKDDIEEIGLDALDKYGLSVIGNDDDMEDIASNFKGMFKELGYSVKDDKEMDGSDMYGFHIKPLVTRAHREYKKAEDAKKLYDAGFDEKTSGKIAENNSKFKDNYDDFMGKVENKVKDKKENMNTPANEKVQRAILSSDLTKLKRAFKEVAPSKYSRFDEENTGDAEALKVFVKQWKSKLKLEGVDISSLGLKYKEVEKTTGQAPSKSTEIIKGQLEA